MKRRLFNLLAGISLVLFVTTVMLWVRSYWVSDRLISVRYFSHLNPVLMLVDGFGSNQGQLILMHDFTHCLTPYDWQGMHSDLGELAVNRGNLPSAEVSKWVWQNHAEFERFHRTPKTIWNRMGIYDVLEFGIENPSWGHQTFISYRLLAGLFAIAPMVASVGSMHRALRLLRMRNLVSRQLCFVCGYDLRATPDRCPECGSVPKTT